MLAEKRLGRREWWFWTLVLFISPLAGILGTYFEIDRLNRDELYFQVSREEAVETARRLARQQGLDVQDWSSFAAAMVDDQLSLYYRANDSEFVREVEELAPAAVIQVSLISPEDGRVFQVRLGTDGRFLEYSRPDPGGQATVSFLQIGSDSTNSPDQSGSGKIDRQVAESLARRAFENRLSQVAGIEFTEPSRDLDEDDEQTIQFRWLGENQVNRDLELRYTVTVAQDQVVAESLRAQLDDDQKYPLVSTLRIVAYSVMGVVAFLLSVYSLFLYFQRSRQGEVSHRRNMLLGLLVALSFTIVAVLSSVDTIATQMNKDISDPVFIFALMAISFGYAFVGAYCGLMWGSGEGEVREAYPGKLTSVDALVLGRWFSQNVASSLVIGTALGLWLLLLGNLVQWPWRGSPQVGVLESTQALITYVRYAGVLVLLAPATTSLPVAILGLLVPITCAWRWFASPRRRIVFLSLLATSGCLWFGLQIYPIQAGLGVTIVTAAFLVISFLRFDLLTTIATISAWNAVSSLINLGANTSFGMPTVTFACLGFAVFLLTQLYFAFQGQRYSEIEVRPLYAEHLAQRQALQAEVSAAREAQLRLAPQGVPQLDGLTLAAACRPSRAVGGDFYDFLKVGRNRLGVFLAEGGDGGLSAALSIAFAKGLLSPMAEQGESVTEMLSVLRLQLAPLRQSNSRMGVLLGIFDLEAGTLEYVRLGDYPRLLIYRDGASVPLADGQSEGQSAQVVLTPNDRIVCFTDGMTATLQAAQSSTVEEWLRNFFENRSTVDASWPEELEKALLPNIKKARRRGVDDDISTILVHFEHRAQLRAREEEVA